MSKRKENKVVATTKNANVVTLENYGILIKVEKFLSFFGGKKDLEECIELLERLFDEFIDALQKGRDLKISHIYDNRKTHYAKDPTFFDFLVKIFKLVAMRLREKAGVDFFQQLIDKRRVERKKSKNEKIDLDKQKRLKTL